MHRERMSIDPGSSHARESLRARAARERERVTTRIANARLAIIGGVAAATCGLAVFIGATSSATSKRSSTRQSGSGAVRSLFGPGPGQQTGAGFGGGWSDGSGAAAPGASSGQSDANSGGS